MVLEFWFCHQKCHFLWSVNSHFCQKCPFLRPKKWHFWWHNQNSKTTFIVQTFPKYCHNGFNFMKLSLLSLILAKFQFCWFWGLFWAVSLVESEKIKKNWGSQVFDDLKDISVWRMGFDNLKVYGDTLISLMILLQWVPTLVQCCCSWQLVQAKCKVAMVHNSCTIGGFQLVQDAGAGCRVVRTRVQKGWKNPNISGQLLHPLCFSSSATIYQTKGCLFPLQCIYED